ncbi:MAG: glycogen debranching enzyme, partial [Actinomycetota bacterium]|nr:glycogen debranching enzyme [Actinomycetota bacterium]
EWLQEGAVPGGRRTDIVWFTVDGLEMSAEQRAREPARAMSAYLNGDDIATSDPRGIRTNDVSFIILFNSNEGAVGFTLPPGEWGVAWTAVIDTNDPARQDAATHAAGESLGVHGRSLVVLQLAGAGTCAARPS